jgi:P4 family phage/plasmid primase-like protien
MSAAKLPTLATTGLSVLDKRAPPEPLQYLLKRGHTRKGIAVANFRYFDGKQTERWFPPSYRGIRSENPTTHQPDPKTKEEWWPLWSIVLPWPDDPHYGQARVEYDPDQQHGKGKGPTKFINSLGPKRPYFPKGTSLKALLDPKQRLYLVESPFKAIAAASHGVLCIGVGGHSGGFEPDTHREAIHPALRKYFLKDREVSLLCDADVGQNLDVRRSLLQFMGVTAAKPFQCKPFYTELPDLGDGKTGVDDYFAASNTLKDFNTLPHHERDSKVVRVLGCALMDKTELGLSDRFVVRAGEDCRHDPRLGKQGAWFSYTDKDGYQQGDVVPQRRMIDVIRTLEEEIAAAKGVGLDDWDKFQKECGRKNAVSNALALARVDTQLDIDAASFDREQDLLGTPNGCVLRLSTGELLKPRRDLMVTKKLGCEFLPNATAPRFAQFLKWMCNGQRDLMNYLQEIAGSCLAGRSARQEVFFLKGGGDNGKSVLIDLLLKALGDYGAVIPAKMLLKAHQQENNPQAATPFLMRLHGKRLAVCSEFEDSAPIDEAMLKDLNGGDMITGRANYCDPFEFYNTARIIVKTNLMPTVVGTSDAVWDRIKIVPFQAKIADKKKDPEFAKKLAAAELPGILAWAYQGFQRLAARNNRFETPRVVDELTNKLRADSDTLGLWLAECVTLDPLKSNSTQRELQTEVTQCSHQWRIDNDHAKMSARVLWKKLREHLGYEPIYRGDHGIAYALGFTLIRSESVKTFAEAQANDFKKVHGENAELKREIKVLNAKLAAASQTKLVLIKGGKKDG